MMISLFTFIGNSDLVAAGIETRDAPTQDGPGPISRAVGSELGPWETVVLVDERKEAERAQRYLAWMRARPPEQAVHLLRTPVANPAEFPAVLEAARLAVQSFGPGLAERAFLSTAGTAAMAMSWMYLALQPLSRARLLTAHIGQPCAWLEVPGTEPRVCVILRGIPGAGKSTLAHALVRTAGHDPADCVFCTDDRFDDLNGGVFDPLLLPRMHQTNLAMFIRALDRRVPLVVCDNTNIEPWEYAPYAAAARALGYRVTERLVGDPRRRGVHPGMHRAQSARRARRACPGHGPAAARATQAAIRGTRWMTGGMCLSPPQGPSRHQPRAAAPAAGPAAPASVARPQGALR